MRVVANLRLGFKGKITSLLAYERQFSQTDIIKQTHDSLIANWIAMFEYSKAHSLENFKMATPVRNRPIYVIHCKPLSSEYVMNVYGLCLFNLILRPKICI